MFMLHTIGFTKDDMKDDVALAKRFVVSLWTQEMQQYQPQIVAIGVPNNTWEIAVPHKLFDETRLVCWQIANCDGVLEHRDQFVVLRFELPNITGTMVTITKNYKENSNERKND